MRRWNGWGDDEVGYDLPPGATRLLAKATGPPERPRDADYAGVLAAVPASRLPDHPLITFDPDVRLRHARGQSLPDWVALRSGCIDAFPDGLAFPESAQEVAALLQYAAHAGVQVIPYGGGTSVVGGINAIAGNRPILTVDLQRMAVLLAIDGSAGLATFGAGIGGPAVEARLRAHGFTLGHYPQSFEYSTLGGWIATRSSGQESHGYGGIEHLFAGGRVETPAGRLDLPAFPASAAGPDLRQLVLGSEGRLGILTEATVRITRVPEVEIWDAVFFPNWDAGLPAVREMAQARLPLSMLRLGTAAETETTLALAGRGALLRILEVLLAGRKVGAGKCLLVLAASGSKARVRAAHGEALAFAGRHGGVHAGEAFGKAWRRSRFRTPYLRNALWDVGYAVDTVETALAWSAVTKCLNAVEEAIRAALSTFGERAHVFSHLSHLYPDGSSIYTTYLFRLAPDPDATLARWRAAKAAATEAVLAHGGTISHHHGVGTDHVAYLPAEKGILGMDALRSAVRVFDPMAIMNPGKLLAGDDVTSS